MRQYLIKKSQEWLNVEKTDIPLLHKLSASFWLIVCYSPLLVLSTIGLIEVFEDGEIPVGDIELFSVFFVLWLFFGTLAQALLDYGAFPSFDKFAKIFTLPVYLIIGIPLRYFFLLIGGFFESFLIPLLGGTLVLSISLFVIFGFAGLLWFGIKQLI